ncbi:hypothetical protein NC652_028497 [Populus alba x Populus x berolinensis]|nr:hypothetical protein NC652_028497 [Populus alba x Populus x berolinensis]
MVSLLRLRLMLRILPILLNSIAGACWRLVRRKLKWQSKFRKR